MYKELKRSHKIELKIYYFLGIKIFRKIILWIENVKNHKNRGINENYHICVLDISSIEKHINYLFYNAFLHSVSILFVLIYYVIMSLVEVHSIFFDVVMFVVLLLNVYCIILQRTNYLKIKDCCYKYYKKFTEKITLSNEYIIQQRYVNQPEKLQIDFDLICRLKAAFEGKSDCYIKDEDIESMGRLCECIEFIPKRKIAYLPRKYEEVKLVEQCKLVLGPHTILEMRVDWLKRKLGMLGREMCKQTVIITENIECEMMYKKLIPADTSYNICNICFGLYEIFISIANKVNVNEL